MTLGLAVIIVFVLYLIDKHNRWRQAMKVVIGLAVLGIVGVGGLFGWQKYASWKEAGREALQEAEYEAEQAKSAVKKQAELGPVHTKSTMGE